MAQRTKQELLDLYQEYWAEPSKRTSTEWIEHLAISPTMFSKWKKKIPPKLPTEQSKKIYAKYKKNTEQAEPIRSDMALVAEELGMSLTEAQQCCDSAMNKIRSIVSSDTTHPLRHYLDNCEQQFMDTNF